MELPPGYAEPISGREFDPANFPQSFWRTTADVLLRPIEFFRELPRQAGYGRPIVYYATALVIYAVLTFLLSLLLPTASVDRFLGGQSASQEPTVAMELLTMILTVAFGLMGLFIGAGFIHVGVLLFGQPQSPSYETTTRLTAYVSGATYMISWIPFIGWLASLYAIYLYIVAVREQYGMSTGRAAAAVLVPGLFLLLVVCLCIAVVGAALFAALSSVRTSP